MAHIPTANGTAMTGATSLVKSLEAADVEVMFGLPGGAILPAYDPIFDSSIATNKAPVTQQLVMHKSQVALESASQHLDQGLQT